MTALKNLLANHTKYYSEAFAQSIRDVLSSTREAGGFENEQILRGGVSGEHWSADLSKKADFQETYVHWGATGQRHDPARMKEVSDVLLAAVQRARGLENALFDNKGPNGDLYKTAEVGAKQALCVWHEGRLLAKVKNIRGGPGSSWRYYGRS